MKKSTRSRQRRRAATPRAGVMSTAAPEVAARETLAARVQAVVERELEAVEQILQKLGPADPGEAERTARTLASLARTLRELARLNESGDAREAGSGDEPIDDEPVPRDLDRFRRALSQRLDRLVAEAKAACPEPGEPDRA